MTAPSPAHVTIDEYRALLREQWSHDQFQDEIVAVAHESADPSGAAWYVWHQRSSRTKDGHRTAVQYDGKGFPDLVLVRPPRIVIYECKVGRDKPRPDQRIWIDKFKRCPAILCRVVYPRDWNQILEDLT